MRRLIKVMVPRNTGLHPLVLLTALRRAIKDGHNRWRTGCRGKPHGQEISMKDDVVIVGAARTPVGAFNGAFGSLPAHELGKAAISEALKRAGVEGGRVSEVIMGQILTAAQGQNPARQASIGGRHSGGEPGLGRQPAVRLGPARGRARLSGDPQRRLRDRGRGRPGIHEHGAARRVPARGPEDGLARNGRHDDQGRPVGCLQRLSHGHDRRERRQAVPDHAQPAGRVRGRVAEQGRGRAEGRQVQGRDRSDHHQVAQGRHRGRHRRVSESRHHARLGQQAASGLRQGRLR